MNNTQENFIAFSTRIKQATGDIEKLRRLERSLDRLFRNGCLSVSEYRQLDDMIFRQMESIPNGMKIIPCTCAIDAPYNCPQHGSRPEWREGREQMRIRAEYIKNCVEWRETAQSTE